MAAEDELLTVAEAVAIIQVSPQWLQEPIARGELPALVVDRRRHVRPADIDAWMETRRAVPVGQPPGGTDPASPGAG